MPLTEEELLLLNCFMYADIAPNWANGTSVETILESFLNDARTEISVEKIKEANVKLSGGLKAEQLADVMQQMYNNDAIMNLRIEKTTPEYEGSIRAACFVDKTTGKATVAFRGTGGSYRQWNNNLEGYGDVLQPTEIAAVDFINSLPYDDIDLTGHSNGSNAAMVTTILCGDKVSRCVGYEGQGVSEEFAEVYADEIEANKHKIKNISGSSDVVNPLLLKIAGENRYVESDSALLIFFNHGCYGILTANKTALENNGGYFPESSYVEQNRICKIFGDFTKMLAKISEVSVIGPILELGTDLAGIGFGLIMSFFSGGWKDPGKLVDAFVNAGTDLVIALKDFVIGEVQDFIEAVEYVCNKVVEWYNKITNKGIKYADENPLIIVDTQKLESYAQRLLNVNRRISTLDRRLDSLYNKVGLLDLWNLMQADILTGYSRKLKKCENYLNETARDFADVEKNLVEQLQ